VRFVEDNEGTPQLESLLDLGSLGIHAEDNEVKLFRRKGVLVQLLVGQVVSSDDISRLFAFVKDDIDVILFPYEVILRAVNQLFCL
jgi:hypothetical protein